MLQQHLFIYVATLYTQKYFLNLCHYFPPFVIYILINLNMMDVILPESAFFKNILVFE